MAKNISLLGADYPDVPAVQLPQTGGGTATFYDIEVIDDLQSTSTTDALSANQGRVLNERFGNYKKTGSVGRTSATSVTFNVPSASTHLVILSAGGQRAWMGLVTTNSNGVLTIIEAAKGSAVSSVTSSENNKLTVAYASASGTNLYDMILAGDAIT